MSDQRYLVWMAAAIALAACATTPRETSTDLRLPLAPAAELQRDTQIKPLLAGMPIVVRNPFGDVRVRFGGYVSQIEWRSVAQNPPDAPALSVHAEQDDRFSLVVRLPDGATQQPGQRLDLTLYVAEKHSLDIETQNGLIEVRGLRAELQARSRSGNITFRGVTGAVDVATDGGEIEGQFEGPLPGTRQRVISGTGAIVLGLMDALNATMTIASSAPFATDFSVEVTQQPGQEPNKTGVLVLGKPESQIEVFSKRGELRLLRRAEFSSVAPEG